MNTRTVTSQFLHNRHLRRFVGGLSVLLLAFGGYLLWKKFGSHNDSLDQYQIASVQRGDVEDLVTATGTLQPREYVDVGAQVSGRLIKIHVEIGSVVETGTLLAEIDPTVYRANVEARRASLRNQRATLIERQAQLALAELQYKRQQNLIAGDATTTESVQAAEASLQSANAQLQALQAQIEQTESTLLADEANLNYAKIYAPMAGVVVSISARQGQTLNTNQSAPIILRIADLSTMTVQTQVSEADVSRLSPNMEAYFTTLGNRGKHWHGQLRKLEPTPTVTNNVVLYNALFDVPNEQRNLLPQMTAQVFFVAASAKDALYIPAAAVAKQSSGPRKTAANGNTQSRENATDEKSNREKKSRKKNTANDSPNTPTTTQVWAGVAAQPRRDGGEATIKVVTTNGDIEERTIKTGISNRIHVQVLSGLNEGDQIIAGLKPPPGAENAQGGNSQGNNQSGQQRERNALQSQGNVPGAPGMGGPR